MCDILQDMRETAHAEGKTEGRSEGMHLFATLIQKLNALGRSEDIKKAVEDNHYRNLLIWELIGE